MSELLETVKSLCSNDSSIKVIVDFVVQDYWVVGKISIDCLGTTVPFNVEIPTNYPLTNPNTDNISIRFYNEDLIGFNHINPDGSVCFHPEKDDNIERKFLSEIEGVKNWINKYLIQGIEDERYTYIIHDIDYSKRHKFFFTNVDLKFKPGMYGHFVYSIRDETTFSRKDRGVDVEVKSMYRIGIEYSTDYWSAQFSGDLFDDNHFIGAWYFLDEEPVVKGDSNRRKGITSWDQFKGLLSDEFIKYLYDGLRRDFGKNYLNDGFIYISFGYKIPNNEGYEVHWDLLKVPADQNPIQTELIPLEQRTSMNKYRGVLTDQKTLWVETENADYSRFFGRGKLSKSITESHILIVGCGALGSMLAENLVRGGARSLILEDFDKVEIGNLCRANFDLDRVSFQKVEALKRRLSSISPFVSINQVDVKMNIFDPEKLKGLLDENIDIIFDCSTDSELLHILDGINYQGKVFSLGITNKAKALACVSGDMLTEKKHHLFNLLENEPADFFEGTGCGYPTFEASYNDVSTLLNIAVNKINRILQAQNEYSSFVTTIRDSESCLQFDTVEYLRYKSDQRERLIYVSKLALSRMEEELVKYYPNEFGGVLVGARYKGVLMISDILVPDEYENGRTKFVRHPGSLNDRLEKLFNESNGRIEYLGEWHSHPDQNAVPSNEDLRTMHLIAEDKKINTNSPILLIGETRKDSMSPRIYMIDSKKLIEYEREN